MSHGSAIPTVSQAIDMLQEVAMKMGKVGEEITESEIASCYLVIDTLDEESQPAIEAFYPDRIRIVQNWFTELKEKVQQGEFTLVEPVFTLPGPDSGVKFKPLPQRGPEGL